VEVPDRVNPIVPDAARLLPGVHAAGGPRTLNVGRPGGGGGGGGCDDRQCRIRLNAARREIDRLRRGFDHVGPPPPRPPIERFEPTFEIVPPGAAERKPYAPDPLGKPTVLRLLPPPDPAAAVWVTNYFHVTNLGTLLDMLA